MQDRHIAAILLIVLVSTFMVPAPVCRASTGRPAAAEHPETRLEPLVNEWRAELDVKPLQGDERLYVAAEDVAGDGTYCPQDRGSIEFTIAEALYRAGYRDKRGYGLVLCGEYPTARDAMDWIRQHGGPSHPDLEDIGVVHLAGLDFVRDNGNHVSDIWVLLAADPKD